MSEAMKRDFVTKQLNRSIAGHRSGMWFVTYRDDAFQYLHNDGIVRNHANGDATTGWYATEDDALAAIDKWERLQVPSVVVRIVACVKESVVFMKDVCKETDKSVSKGSISQEELLVSGLFLIFTYLKLTKQIDWSWWWVVSPFWLPLAGVAAIAAICSILLLVVKCYQWLSGEKIIEERKMK